MRVAIVVPSLDEADRIEEAVTRLRALRPQPDIVVADGASTDGTAALAQRAGARVVHSARGRAVQMNRGAAAAHGDVLLFLHADTLLSQEAYGAMLRALEEPTVVGGCFRLRFDARHPLLWLASFSTRFKLPFVHLGDSAYFLRRDVFDALGGYRDMPVLEDLDLWRRLNRSHKTVLLSEHVVTSARRLMQWGVARQQLIGTVVVALHLAGVSPARLARFYGRLTPAGR